MDNYFFSDLKKNKHVKKYLDGQLSKYGMINYVYAIMNKANTDKMAIISSLPDNLVANYLNKKTQNIDPIIINALNRVTSFSWDENMKINSKWTIKRVFDPVRPYNMISGYAFVLHDHKNNLAILSLYIDKDSKEDDCKIIDKNKSEFQLILIHAHDMLIRSFRDKEVNTCKSITPRESEILYFCTAGKTYSEISDLLYISVSTVKFHMANIVKKMGVRNAKHAISLSVELNIALRQPEKGR